MNKFNKKQKKSGKSIFFLIVLKSTKNDLLKNFTVKQYYGSDKIGYTTNVNRFKRKFNNILYGICLLFFFNYLMSFR